MRMTTKFSRPGTLMVVCLATAMLLAAFVEIEYHSGSPMLPLGLFRRRPFTGAQVAASPRPPSG